MDYERLLISKAAQTGRIQNLLAAGFSEVHFSDELQPIFTFLTDHARKYRQAPSFETVRSEFPDHNFEVSDESFDFLVDEFTKQLKRKHAITAVRDLAEAIDDSKMIASIDSLFLEKSRELATLMPSASVHRFSDMEDRVREYEASNAEDAFGIKMGIPAMDAVTLGIQPHEYMTIMGWSGTGKSTLAQWMLFNFWAQSKTSMFISMEMEARALFRKWDTMVTHFDYHRLKAHELREEELDKWRTRAGTMKDHPGDIIVMDDIKNFNVDRAYAEIVRWKPDIVCIDYITLMDAQRSAGKQVWEKVQYLTQNLKQIARTTKTPIIGIAQTNRESAKSGAELHNVGSGVSIVQDSDLVLGLRQSPEQKENKQMVVDLLKNRDGMNIAAELLWDMNTMSFGEWKTSTAFQAKYVES